MSIEQLTEVMRAGSGTFSDRIVAARKLGYRVEIVDHGVREHTFEDEGETFTHRSRDISGLVVVDGIECGLTLASDADTPDGPMLEHIKTLVEFAALNRVIDELQPPAPSLS